MKSPTDGFAELSERAAEGDAAFPARESRATMSPADSNPHSAPVESSEALRNALDAAHQALRQAPHNAHTANVPPAADPTVVEPMDAFNPTATAASPITTF